MNQTKKIEDEKRKKLRKKEHHTANQTTNEEESQEHRKEIAGHAVLGTEQTLSQTRPRTLEIWRGSV